MKTLFVVVFCVLTNLLYAQDNNTDKNKMLQEAIALQNDGKISESNKIFSALYAMHYMTDYVCYNMASNYYKLKDYKRAERFANEAATDGSGYILQATLVKSDCMYANNQKDIALQLLTEVAQKYKNIATPQLHLRIAHYNNEKQLYIHAFLAYYMCLFIQHQTHGTQLIGIINQIMNTHDVNNIIDEKTALDSKLTKEDCDLIWAMLFLKDLTQCSINQDTKLPEMQIFVENSKSLITNICESIDDKTGFYEEYYINFYNKILKDNMIDEFLYYCLVDTYPNIGDVIENMTSNKMNSFADWLEKNFLDK